MRALLALIVVLVALTAIGCYHDKYNVIGPKREDYEIPPHEPRFDEPPKENWRPPPPPKQQDTLMNRNNGGAMGSGAGAGGRPGGLGGF
jgi:hypothetical protein